MQRLDSLVGLIEQILVRYAPAADELRRRVVLAIHDRVKAVAEKEAAHVVEMRFAAVHEFVVITLAAQQRRQREEILAAISTASPRCAPA